MKISKEDKTIRKTAGGLVILYVFGIASGIPLLQGQQQKWKNPQQKFPQQQQQQQGPDPCRCKEKLDRKKIDEAIKKGCDYLLQHIDETLGGANNKMVASLAAMAPELVLLTLIHGGYFNEKDEKCKKLLDFVLKQESGTTYRTALKAMALGALDKDKYVEFIAECGQAIVDGQRKEGNWTYTLPAPGKDVETPGGPKIRETKGGHGTSVQKARPKLKPARQLKNGGMQFAGGDNSNTQYAALGLRACHDAGIEIPKEALTLAKEWWEKDQNAEGGWGYPSTGGGFEKNKGSGVQDARHPKNLVGGYASATMTAGGIACLSIYKYLLGECKKPENFAKDSQIAAGIKWLANNFEEFKEGKANNLGIFSNIGGRSQYWDNYYLTYGVERAGKLAEFAKLGKHDWYTEGAHWLLEHQEKDGSWKGNYGQVIDTCFAVLFLKKATESFFETERGAVFQ